MSEQCLYCGNLITKKYIATHNSCKDCHKAKEQMEKQKKKMEENERKQNEKLIKRASGSIRIRRGGNLNF